MAAEPPRRAPPRKKPVSRATDTKVPRDRIPLPPAYLRLLEQFRLRPFRTEEVLDQAIALVDHLISRRQPLLPEEEDYTEGAEPLPMRPPQG